jgi:secreted trypsin-like serine protease
MVTWHRKVSCDKKIAFYDYFSNLFTYKVGMWFWWLILLTFFTYFKRFCFSFPGGREAAKGRWSWQVAILNKYREVFCGGTLIAPGWVLTAAHCVRKHLFVKLGEHDLIIKEVT